MKPIYTFILLVLIVACNQPNENAVTVVKKDTWRDSLAHELSIIMESDQACREPGSTSPNNDYYNTIKVKAILDKYGWLGADSIGNQGNTTLFLVIHHRQIFFHSSNI